jgi:hypothetical protein
MNRKLIQACVLAGLICASSPVLAADPFFFVPGRLTQDWLVSAEASTGTRDAGVYGRHGTAAAARAALAHAGWTLEAAAGVVDNTINDQTEQTYLAEGRYSWDNGLAAGAGYRYDYDGVSVPYLHFLWNTEVASRPLAFSAQVEFPQSRSDSTDRRDSTDLLLAAAAGLPCFGPLSCAFEIAAEDIEGFFEEEEAEGGAKFILGPTLAWRWQEDREIKLFAGWIHALTANEPTREDFPDYRGHRDGMMLRLALGFGA